MKRIIRIAFEMLLLILLCLEVEAESISQSLDYVVDDLCSFKILNAQSYDIFMNQESGSTKEYIVITFKLLNYKKDKLNLKKETKSKLLYNEDFVYESDYLWTNPEGSYINNNNEKLFVFEMNESGKISYCRGENSYTDVDSGGYERLSIEGLTGWYNEFSTYDPINARFVYDEKPIYNSIDPDKTILDPLESRVFHYVYLVPDIVANDIGFRTFVFSVGNDEYELTF